MPQAKIAHVEIESLDEFDAHIQHATVLRDWTIQSIDLTGRAAALARVDVSGALFLGCQLPQELEDELRDRGALVFSTLPSVPFNPYRNSMYRAVDLYDALLSGGQYATTFDARVYAWAQTQSTPPAIPASLAMSLHDHALTDALDDFFTGRDDTDAIGIMGGHATLRGSDDYIGAARLASLLALAGKLVITGGGPGSMEAANLGARLAGQYALLTRAISTLSSTPSYTPEPTTWAAPALEIAQSTRPSGVSLGIPTWFYGHEPPNAFATYSAKYFSNALREDILLQRCRGGLVYLPGAAGTVQEIFQAATRNYYAPDDFLLSPMILVDV